MKIRLCVVLAVCLLTGLFIPGKAEAKKKKMESLQYPLISSQPIRQIVNHTAFDVMILPGDENKIDVRGTEETFKGIAISLSDGILRINYLADTSQGEMTIYVTSNDVNSISLMGSGGLHAESLDSNLISVGLYGSGSIFVTNLQARKARINLRGSGDVSIGKADVTSAEVTLLGSGSIKMRGVEASSLDCVLKGSGDINIQNINARIVKGYCFGSGDIMLSGKSATCTLLNQGSGGIYASKLKTNNLTKVNKGTGEIDD